MIKLLRKSWLKPEGAISKQNKDQEHFASLYKEEIEQYDKYEAFLRTKKNQVLQFIKKLAQKLDTTAGWT